MLLPKEAESSGMVVLIKTKGMKKITKEEAGKLILKRGSSTPVRTAIMHLGLGEILQIDPQEWTQSKGPGQMLTRLTKRTGMEFKLNAIADAKGWIVERVK